MAVMMETNPLKWIKRNPNTGKLALNILEVVSEQAAPKAFSPSKLAQKPFVPKTPSPITPIEENKDEPILDMDALKALHQISTALPEPAVDSPVVATSSSTPHTQEVSSMSLTTFVAEIKSAEHTFVAYFEKEAIVVEKAAPGVERVIAACLNYTKPMLDIALKAVGLPAADIAALDNAFTEANDALTVASSVVYDAGSTPTAASLFSSVATNLSGILTTVKVTNPATVSAVNKVVANIGAVAEAINVAAAGISSSTASTTAPTTPVATPVVTPVAPVISTPSTETASS